MRFQELREYYEAEDDNINTLKVNDTRRARITLKHLNKLRKKRELDKLEDGERQQNLSKIYGKPAE
tara:strand:- start:2690 stop:2887 length:198 start_codon:yes stop_codon:yes gene_type:complete